MNTHSAITSPAATTIDPCTSETGNQTEGYQYAQAQAQAAAHEAAQLARAAASEASRRRAAGGVFYSSSSSSSTGASRVDGMSYFDTSATAAAGTPQETGTAPVQVPQYGPPLHRLIYRPREDLSKRKRHAEEQQAADASSATTEESRALWATLSRQTSWSHIQRSTSNGNPADGWSASSDADAASSTGGAARLVKRMRIDPEHMRASSEIALGGGSSAPSTSTSFAGLSSDGAAGADFTGTPSGSDAVPVESGRSRSISRESSARSPTIEETYAWALAPPPLSHSSPSTSLPASGLLNADADTALHADLDRMDDDEPMASQRTAGSATDSQIHPDDAMADETMTGVAQHQHQQQQDFANPSGFRLTLDPSVAGHPHPYSTQPYFAT